MRVILGVIVFSCIISVAHSQNVVNALERLYHHSEKKYNGVTMLPRGGALSTRATRSTPFYTEDFGNYTGTGVNALPVGWTATTIRGNGTWRWTNAAASGAFSVGTLASPTTSNGWMLYSSDSIAVASGFTSGQLGPSGALISPSIDCSMHPTVKLSFSELFKRFADSAVVEVSDNGGATWVRYVIPVNSFLPDNSSTNNPENVAINITPTAGGKPNVKLKFHYSCSYFLGGYNWLIDDVQLSELDPVDLVVSNLAPYYSQGFSGNNTTFASIPHHMAVPFTLKYDLLNFGSMPLNNLSLNCRTINLQNSFTADNQNVTHSLPVSTNAVTTSATNSILPGVNVYRTVITCNPAGEATPHNNTDTTFFEITKDKFSQSTRIVSSIFTVNRPVGVFSGVSQQGGTLYLIPDGKSDTMTHARVCFQHETTPGVQVIADVYRVDLNQANPFTKIATSDPYTVSAGEISTTQQLRYANIPIPFVNINGTNPIVQGGLYLVSIRGHAVTNQTINIYSTNKQVPTETLSVADNNNNGSLINATGNAFTLGLIVPMVDWIFANDVNTNTSLGISDVQLVNNWVKLSPVPATTTLKIEFEETLANDATIEVYNIFGALQSTKTFNGSGTLDISNLPSATYIVKVYDGKKMQNLKFVKY